MIPRLTGVLTDSHAQVRAAANKSLKQFGEVISNPEIQNLVPVFLKAMVDPAKTPNALTALLKTSFAHYIDHSSLALVRVFDSPLAPILRSFRSFQSLSEGSESEELKSNARLLRLLEI